MLATTQNVPSTKTECDYLNGWIKKKKRSHTQKLTQNGESQRYSWGTQKKKKKKKLVITVKRLARRYAYFKAIHISKLMYD